MSGKSYYNRYANEGFYSGDNDSYEVVDSKKEGGGSKLGNAKVENLDNQTSDKVTVATEK